MRVIYDDVVSWHTPVLFPFHEGKVPATTEADEGGEEGQQYRSEQSEAIIPAYGET